MELQSTPHRNIEKCGIAWAKLELWRERERETGRYRTNHSKFEAKGLKKGTSTVRD